MLPHGRNTPCSGLARLDLATARRLRLRLSHETAQWDLQEQMDNC
jgi:hypothetical protein